MILSSYSLSTYNNQYTQNNTATQTTNTTTQTNSILPTNLTKSTSYGFKTDDNGFFGADFNKASGIPDYVKVNVNTLDDAKAFANEYAKVTGKNLSAIEVVSKAWNNYEQLAGNLTNPNGDGSLSESQYKSMTYSYESKLSFIDDIVSVNKTFDDDLKTYNYVQEVSDGTMISIPNDFIGGIFSPTDVNSVRTSTENHLGSGYFDNMPDKTVSISSLFANFIDLNSGFGTTFSDSQNSYTSISILQAKQNYNDFLSSGKSIKDYLSDTIGLATANSNAAKIATLGNGTIDTNLFDLLFEQIDKVANESRQNLQKQYSSQNANNTTYSNSLSLTSLANKFKMSNSANT